MVMSGGPPRGSMVPVALMVASRSPRSTLVVRRLMDVPLLPKTYQPTPTTRTTATIDEIITSFFDIGPSPHGMRELLTGRVHRFAKRQTAIAKATPLSGGCLRGS